MDNVDQQSIEQGASIVALRVQLGGLLSRERLNQQKDVLEVARRLMLSKLQLLAIEAGEAASFHHEQRYIQGIKAYVFYLGLQSRAEVNALVSQIESWSAESLHTSPAEGVAKLHRVAATSTVKKSYASRSPRYLYVGLGVLVLGAITLAITEGWPFSDEQEDIVTVVPAESATITSTAVPITPPQARPASSNTASSVTEQSPSVASTLTSRPLEATTPVETPASVPASVSTPVTTPVIPTPVIASAPAPTPVPVPEVKATMRIDFTGGCWVSLQTADGKRVDRIYKSGESLSVPIANVSGLVLGNAPAANVFLAGRQVNVLAKGLTQGNVTRLDQKSIQLLQKE